MLVTAGRLLEVAQPPPDSQTLDKSELERLRLIWSQVNAICFISALIGPKRRRRLLSGVQILDLTSVNSRKNGAI